ncbi:MAG: pantetheine-phosphate adenylyltransferase [Candidatus Tenebribacter davisii]|jgi:pantetheine-phosphate adenylyltransferase|nr:pantetheine-phosphate adenylyltransferase [Candidatus Tenebribacter davisii]
MKIALYAGTFDPITNGHIDILTKASKVFDKIILAVADNTGKDTIFTLEERTDLCKRSIVENNKIEVMNFSGLAIDFANEIDATTMIRGLRALSDFEYELSLTLMNKNLCEELETVFFVPDNKYLYLSSTMIREVVSLGGAVSDFVPDCVEEALIQKFKH